MYIYTRQFHSQAYFITLVLLAVSIPLSRFTMSVFQFTLLGLWIWAGFSFEVVFRIFRRVGLLNGIRHFVIYMLRLTRSNFVDKTELFFRNRVAVIVASLFLIHIIGLIHTVDFNYALKDLRTKLPILFLPMVLSTMDKISWKQLRILLILYVMAVFAGTMFSLVAYLQKDFTNIREISLFISPVRFSLNILFSFFILGWFVLKDRDFKWTARVGMISMMIWFIIFLIILESLIGMLGLLIISVGILLFLIFSIRQLAVKVLLAILLVSIPVVSFLYVRSVVIDLTNRPEVDLNNLPTHTKLGNPYRHDTINFGVEDGRYIGLFFAEEELKEAWNERSKIDFYGKDKATQDIQYTIIRYLNSLDLPKDAEGVAALTNQDISLIERGVANYHYVANPSIRIRVSKILMGYWQYTNDNDPSGSSVMQRLEHLKASIIIIRNNFWVGVGTGDLPMIFEETYKQMQSPLKKQWQWRSHNQYLSVFVAFGVFGFLWFLFTLLYPYFALKRYNSYFYSVFLALLMLSMFTEDTIESQDGVTLFAFFNSLFLFAYAWRNKHDYESKKQVSD
jgi:hypothetical protein